MSERVIIDTDMGIGEAGADIDDAFAVALAAASSELRIDAVTTVNGNAPLEAGTRATLRLLATSRGTGETSDNDSCAMHDPLAVAAAFRPDLLSWREAFVQVEACGEVARGVSVADFGARAGHSLAPNSRVAVDVQPPEVTDLLLERVASL